ncbi:MAG: sporulation protein YabP [Lachnospiraceae bacterium]|nr:sporulation protein YabP [Lachnospiraceae bacterium]
MEDLNSGNRRQHKMVMVNRKNCSLTGVADVIAFDENEVILETDMGILMLKGQGLHVKRLTLEQGEVELEGKVDSFLYSEQKNLATKSESFLGRLFK